MQERDILTARTQQQKTASHDPATTDLSLWYDIKDVANSENKTKGKTTSCECQYPYPSELVQR